MIKTDLVRLVQFNHAKNRIKSRIKKGTVLLSSVLFIMALGIVGYDERMVNDIIMRKATVLSNDTVKCENGNVYIYDDLNIPAGKSVNVYFDTMGTNSVLDDAIIKIMEVE